MRKVNLFYRQLIVIIILWQVISCSETSHKSTTATLSTPSTTIITVSPKVSRVNDHLMNNLTADGSIEGDNTNTVNTRTISTNDFVSNVTNVDQKTNQELKAITNQTSDINNNTSHINNTNYTNDFDKLNTTSRRKWTEPEKVINRIKRARGRGKNQGYDATDRAKAQGKSSAFSTNFQLIEKQFTLYLTSTLSMLILTITQSLPVSL